MRHLLMVLVASLLFPSAACSQTPTNQYWPWAVYYNDKAPVSDFAPFKLLVFDSTYHPPIAPLQQQGKKVLGYVSLGEIEQQRPWFAKAQQLGLLLMENRNWPGSFFVDARKPEWKALVLEEIMPSIAAKGFDGFFYDTLDNAAFLEEDNPVLYSGMKQAAQDVLHAIRQQYPDKLVMMNRGYGLLPTAAKDIDMLLAESFLTNINFPEKTYEAATGEDFRYQQEKIAQARSLKPGLGIYTLDYWYPEKTAEVQRLYDLQKRMGYSPYVSTIELDTLFIPPSLHNNGL